MNNFGKDQFDSIPIPEKLEKTVRRAARRGMVIRTAEQAGAVLCLLAVLIGFASNTPRIYAATADLPVLGPIVRLMHIGSGGVPGQTVCGYAARNGDTVSIRFTTPSGEGARVPEFSVIQRDYPRRTVLHFHGIARMEQLPEKLKNHPAVSDAYVLNFPAEDEMGVNIITRSRPVCAEYIDGTLQISFQTAEPPPMDTAYVLCSEPAEPEEAAELYERLAWEGATEVRTEDGRYQVFLGEFSSLERAEKAQAGIRSSRNIKLGIKKIHF